MSELIAVITAGLFAAGTMLAADPSQCAEQIAECKASLAKLEAPSSAKNIFNQALDNYGKNGCPPDGDSVIKQYAMAIFKDSPEGYATFKSECKLMPTK